VLTPGRAARPSRHPLGLVLLVVATALAGLAVPAGAGAAAEPPPPPPEPTPRVVGGSVAPPGAWPSHAGVYSNGGYRCGATVIDASWALTAAHCVSGRSASTIQVLTGTQTRSSGGTRYQAQAIRIVPGYDPKPDPHRDIAVIQLRDPTSAPHQFVVPPGVEVPAGTPATLTGWGSVSPGGPTVDTLREVTVPVISDQECRDAGYGDDIISSSMLCAGERFGGEDTCQGDSGGPLVIDAGGFFVQVGVTSFGIGCGEYPGVYAKVSAFSSWIYQQVVDGPHLTDTALVNATYRDLYNRAPTSSERSAALFALSGGQLPPDYVAERLGGSSYQSRAGGVARLYRAFFLRDPDTPGMQYWWSKIYGGRPLSWVADYMATSPEFVARYGSLDDAGFVDRVYENVLGRPADPSGAAYWTNELATGHRSRGQVMIGFSESAENRAATQDEVDVIITTFALLRRVPCSCEVDLWAGAPVSFLVGALVATPEYAGRY